VFTASHRIKQIDYCWDANSGYLTGLQTTVGLPTSNDRDIRLNRIGFFGSACASFKLLAGEEITTIYIAHSGSQVTALSVTTNKNNGFTTGSLRSDSNTVREPMGQGLPMMGLYGTSTSSGINSLGLVSFWAKTCSNYHYTTPQATSWMFPFIITFVVLSVLLIAAIIILKTKECIDCVLLALPIPLCLVGLIRRYRLKAMTNKLESVAESS
jgi:hypothetical protein